jgi:hypothetical protein
MKAIIPKKANFKAVMAELEKEMRAIHKDVDKDFDSTVQTWEHRVKFDREFKSSSKQIRFATMTADEIYQFVSGGTRPHRIVPKRAKVLRFPGTYSAKTSPGTIPSGSGGSSGPDVFSKGVNHPGTKAREFDEQIRRKWERPFRKRLTAAMGRAAKKSGHAI